MKLYKLLFRPGWSRGVPETVAATMPRVAVFELARNAFWCSATRRGSPPSEHVGSFLFGEKAECDCCAGAEYCYAANGFTYISTAIRIAMAISATATTSLVLISCSKCHLLCEVGGYPHPT